MINKVLEGEDIREVLMEVGNLTYVQQTKMSIEVYLDKKWVGNIVKVSNGWQYWARGKKKNAGDVYPDLLQVKASLSDEG